MTPPQELALRRCPITGQHAVVISALEERDEAHGMDVHWWGCTACQHPAGGVAWHATFEWHKSDMRRDQAAHV